MSVKDKGAFGVEAQQIISAILDFQKCKRERKIFKGYPDDPENLFCEELKNWAASELSVLAKETQTVKLITLRLRYIEQVLFAPTLFEIQSGLGDTTIQHVMVGIRKKLIIIY